MTTCTRRPDGYWTAEHQPECRDRLCPGCVACTHDEHGNPVRHCPVRTTCTAHLGWDETACPRCLGRIRSDLDGVLHGMALMPEEAEHAGIESSAMVLAGPVANPIKHRWRLVNASVAGEDVEEPDERDPYTALATRERLVREELGHDDLVLCSETLSGTVAYLRWVLSDLTTPERLPLLLEVAGAAARSRAHVEAIEHDSRGGERGAPCPACASPAPKLVKRWAHWCERADCTREHDTSGARDSWQCPRDPEHWWSEADYRLWVADDYLANAERLTAEQLLEQTGIPTGTTRRWASEGKVRRRGKDQRGRTLYDVADVRRVADGTRSVG